MRLNSMMCVLLGALLTGCPVPSEEGADGTNSNPGVPGGEVGKAGKAGKAGGPGGPGGPGAGGPGGPGAGGPGAGGPGAGGPGGPGGASGVLMVLAEMPPQQTQEEVEATGSFHTISGEVKGECTGTVRVDVIDESLAGAPPSPDGGVPGPLTMLTMDSVGAFAVKVPKEKGVNLTAICDSDNDGKISNTVDSLSLGAKLGQISGDQDGVTLELSVLSASGSPEGSGGPPPGGQGGAGGPPPGGQGGAGGPPGGPGGAGGPPPGGAEAPAGGAP